MPYLSLPFVITTLLIHLLHLSDNSQVEKFHINHGPKLCQIYHVMYILQASQSQKWCGTTKLIFHINLGP